MPPPGPCWAPPRCPCTRRAARSASRAEPLRAERPAFSLGEALTPAAALLVAGAVLVGLILLARPHAVLDYARAHETFVIGAAAIAALGVTLASGLMLMLRRS